MAGITRSVALGLRSRAIQKSSSLHNRPLSTKTFAPQSSLARTGLYGTVFALATGLFVVYYFDARSAFHRYLVTPLLRNTLDAETGHKVAVKVLRSGFAPRDPLPDDDVLKSRLWGQTVSNPVGVAAGFDKDGEAIDGLFNLGFSWVEIGSVTPKPQPGNPRPRVFHLTEDSALINRYGFPSQGHAYVLSRLRARIPSRNSISDSASLRPESILAVNLGKNKDSPTDSIDDFVVGIQTFGPYADVLVVNVSSPNTPGLRGLQNRDHLEGLLSGATAARDELPTDRKPKLVLKIAPDLNDSQLDDIAEVIRNSHIDGVIVSNTTVQRPSTLRDPNKNEVGGLSGAPIKPYSLKALKTLRGKLPASIPLIGCGGISTGADVLEYGEAGASFVQVYTGFGYDGVGACRRIKDQLTEELRQRNTTWEAVVSKAVEKLSYKEPPPETGVQKLIDEAQELKKLLDGLEGKFGGEEAQSTTLNDVHEAAAIRAVA